eukprot:619598-Rhodomonas_salina.1
MDLVGSIDAIRVGVLEYANGPARPQAIAPDLLRCAKCKRVLPDVYGDPFVIQTEHWQMAGGGHVAGYQA